MAVTHAKAIFSLDRKVVDILEFNKDFFNKNSPILMPAPTADDKQKEIPGIKGLAAVYKQFEFDGRKRMIVAGHTDTGDIEKHYKLAALRAEGIICLLQGTKNRWVDISYANQKIEDYQRIMKYFHLTRNWRCNPVKIDGTWDDKDTYNAIKEFIKAWNKKRNPDIDSKLADDIKADDKKLWPKRLWEAVFDLYIEELCKALKIKPRRLKKLPDPAKIPRAKIKWVKDDKKFVGCGESFPLDATGDEDEKKKNKYRYGTERKVDILFFYDKEGPWGEKGSARPCLPESDRKHAAANCPLWRKNYFVANYIDPAVDLKTIAYHLKFSYYNQTIITDDKPTVKDVPGGLTIKVYHYLNPSRPATKTQIDSFTKFHDGIYTVHVEDSDTRKNIHFEFDTVVQDAPPRSQWIYTKDDATAPKIEIKKNEDMAKLLVTEKLAERLNYYDLPKLWSSQNYWTRYETGKDGMGKLVYGGGRFENALKTLKLKPYKKKTMTSDKPLIFSLDDIVLVRKNGKQNVRDRKANNTFVNLGNSSRITLLHVDLASHKLVLYKPRTDSGDRLPAVPSPFYSKIKFKSNLIHDVPPDTRMIVFANGFYSVSDKRAGQTNATFNHRAKQIRGCRSACRNDPDYYFGTALKSSSTYGHYRYFAKGTSNFELHYVHHGCIIPEVDWLKVRSFLIHYWNGRFRKQARVSRRQLERFEKSGLQCAKERWENKEYTFEPFKLPADNKTGKLQIVPTYFFEAKPGNRAGRHKCQVLITRGESGEMGPDRAKMCYKDFQDRDYFDPPIGNYTDYDTKVYGVRTVAHEIGHAMGKDDEYAYDDGEHEDATDHKYAQYYPGMPYNFDKGSLMVTNRAMRIKQYWFYVNRLNDASADANELQKLLGGTKYKIIHRFTKNAADKKFNYYLSDAAGADYRDIYKPFKVENLVYRAGKPLVAARPGPPPIPERPAVIGRGKCRLALYKMGEDELSWSIEINNASTAFAFDAIVVVYMKINFVFRNLIDRSDPVRANWINNRWDNSSDATSPDSDTWKDNVKSEITNLNERFYLQNTDANKKDFKNTYIFFFPVCLEDEPDGADYTIRATYNKTDRIRARVDGATTLNVGNQTSPLWIARYMLGQDPANGAAVNVPAAPRAEIQKNDLIFIRDWVRTETGDATFTLKDA